MVKYKVGDKVRIVSEMPRDSDFALDMRRFLGGEITISKVTEWDGSPHYYSEEATPKGLVDRALFSIVGVPGYYFRENWIAGLAESEKFTDENLSVNIHFHGRLTVAELIKDGKVVKAENARCNPKDKFSMAEGARIAVERLFQKKAPVEPKTPDKPSEFYVANLGDRLIVTGNSHTPRHHFRKGTIVTNTAFSGKGSILCEADNGVFQFVSRFDLKPYKEKGE